MKTDPRKAAALRHLQQTLGYEFHQLDLLKQALTHRSFAAKNNERFEFVGDAILNYTVAKMLFVAFPKLSEGELSRLRANLVNQDTLAEMALAMQVGDALYLGQGELKSGGFRRPSILADAMEAMFAAISFDADFARAEKAVCKKPCRHAVWRCPNTALSSSAAKRMSNALWCRATWASWATKPKHKAAAAAKPNKPPPKPPCNGLTNSLR